MTISNIPIALMDFSRMFHDYIKHTHRLDWLQQVFPWLCQEHTSSTDFSNFFHHYIKHTHRFDWLQQVFSWLYQAHQSPRLISASLSEMVVFDIVMAKSGEVSRGDGCVWYSHWKTCWSQSRRWVCLI
jgi:hypothetical protein